MAIVASVGGYWGIAPVVRCALGIAPVGWGEAMAVVASAGGY